jgi:hypothetical protein
VCWLVSLFRHVVVLVYVYQYECKRLNNNKEDEVVGGRIPTPG